MKKIAFLVLMLTMTSMTLVAQSLPEDIRLTCSVTNIKSSGNVNVDENIKIFLRSQKLGSVFSFRYEGPSILLKNTEGGFSLTSFPDSFKHKISCSKNLDILSCEASARDGRFGRSYDFNFKLLGDLAIVSYTDIKDNSVIRMTADLVCE